MKINIRDIAIIGGIAIGGYLLYKTLGGLLDIGGKIAEPIKDVAGTVETVGGASQKLSEVVGVPVGTEILTQPLPETIFAYEGKVLDYVQPVVGLVSQPSFIADVISGKKKVAKTTPGAGVTMKEHQQEVLTKNILSQKTQIKQTLPFKLIEKKLGFDPLNR